ncbi:Wzz/FepE/Etk N-terminal domain-containing protein [Sandarakinorhabdus sp.]|uniref:Wzz/FepE/Etk N-terminal domain-containing protein n=1 Tax=Sandarakinorhabdus sp. TaxID=1916663 RepID=UPI00333F7B03
MSIIQLLRILFARRWVLAIAVFLSVAVAGAVGLILPPRYPATARVLMDNFKPDPVTGQIISGNGLRVFITTQLELIKDYRIAGDAVDRLGLTSNADLLANWQSETGGYGDFRRWLADRLVTSVTVNIVPDSNIMVLTYEANNPEVARRTVNALRDAYIENSLKFRTDAAGRTAEWYREQAGRALRAVEAAEAVRTKFEQENGIVMTAAGEVETVKLSSLQAALTAARSNQGLQQFEAMRQATASTLVDQLKMQLSGLTDQIGQASERLGTQHPTYVALVSRRIELERQLVREKTSARAAGAAQLGATSGGIAQLESQYTAQRGKVFAMKDKLDRLTQLTSEVELRRGQYEQAAKRTSELQLESNVADAGLVVLGDATVSTTPEFPKWPQIFGLALGAGMALGVVMSMLVELINRRVRGGEDLAYAARVPVFAVIADRQRPEWQLAIKRLLNRRGRNAPGWQPAQ